MGGDAKGPILTAAVITWGASVSNSWKKKNTVGAVIGPTVAVFIMVMFLTLIASVNRRLGVTFAALIAVGSLAYNGQALFSMVSAVQSGSTAATGSGTPAPWVWPNLNPFNGIDIRSKVFGNPSTTPTAPGLPPGYGGTIGPTKAVPPGMSAGTSGGGSHGRGH